MRCREREETENSWKRRLGGKQVEGDKFWLVGTSETTTAAVRPGQALGKATGSRGPLQKAKLLGRCRGTEVVVTLEDGRPHAGCRAAPRLCAGPSVRGSFSILGGFWGFFPKAEL